MKSESFVCWVLVIGGFIYFQVSVMGNGRGNWEIHLIHLLFSFL